MPLSARRRRPFTKRCVQRAPNRKRFPTLRILDLFLTNDCRQDFLDLLDILQLHPFAAPVAAVQRVEDVLPHGSRRLKPARPLAAPLQFPAKLPHPREALGTQKAPLARRRVEVVPFNFHDDYPGASRSRPRNSRKSSGGGISQCIASWVIGCLKPNSVACKARRGAPLSSALVRPWYTRSPQTGWPSSAR